MVILENCIMYFKVLQSYLINYNMNISNHDFLLFFFLFSFKVNPYFSMISKEFIILSYSLYALGHSFLGGRGQGLFVCLFFKRSCIPYSGCIQGRMYSINY